MKNSIGIAIALVALVSGIAIGYILGPGDGESPEETDNPVEYRIEDHNDYGKRVYYLASHNAEKPMWVTVYVDGQQMTLKNGTMSVITDSTQKINFDFDNPTSYDVRELKNHITLRFDGVEGKKI